MPVTRVRTSIPAPSRRAASASEKVSWLGSRYPSSGMNAAARTPSVLMGGKSCCASAAETISIGSPNVFAHAAWRRISSSLGSDEASRRPPSWCQPGSFPVSSFSSA